MAQADKKKWVTHKTWKTYKLSDVMGYEKTEADGTIFVSKVWCMSCKQFEKEIKRDPKVRGVACKEIDRYISGTSFVTKYTCKRHLESAASKLLNFF